MRVMVAHRSVPAEGEVRNGDRAVYRSDTAGHLLAVVDGLGHGTGAEEASSTAEIFFNAVDLALPLEDLMAGAHRALLGTRGAAATVCVLRNSVLSVCAVGNVELRSGSLRLPLVTSPGVLGTRVSKFRVCEAPVVRRARLILFSDGISSRARFDDRSGLAPVMLCEQVMLEHRKEYDDSTILVADLEPLP